MGTNYTYKSSATDKFYSIGESRWGWYFLFTACPELNIFTWADWANELETNTGTIYEDNSLHVLSLGYYQFKKIVLDSSNNPKNLNYYFEYLHLYSNSNLHRIWLDPDGFCFILDF